MGRKSWKQKVVPVGAYDYGPLKMWPVQTLMHGECDRKGNTSKMSSCGLAGKWWQFWTHCNKIQKLIFLLLLVSFHVITRKISWMFAVCMFVYNGQLCLENGLQ